MRILLDTHIFIWWLKNDTNLSKKARELIVQADTVFISSVSIWEAAIKIQLGKLNANINELVNAINETGFEELPFTAQHAATIINLPNHHRDPFDRALIAQAISEPLRLLSSNKVVEHYSELVLLV